MARQRFDMPVGDRQYDDPTKIGGGVGTEHMHGNDPSTWTEAPDETQRYRGMGEAAAKRQAYQVDFGKAMADEQRGLGARDAQMNAVGLMRDAAAGNAPSQAAILGNQAAGQSLQAQMQASAGGRGLGAVAAQQQAAQAMQAQQLGNVGQFAGMRGNEMGRAQGAYGQAGGQVRAGDYAQQGMAQQRAEAQGQVEATQRRLNQEAQMGYEQMGINNQQAQSDSDIRNAAVRDQQNRDTRNAHDARNARNMNMAVSGMTALGTVAGSDERMKQGAYSISDDRAKLAKAWDEGHAAAVADVGKLGGLSAVALKQRQEPVAKAVRDVKADAWDEGRGRPKEAPPPPAEPYSPLPAPREMQRFIRQVPAPTEKDPTAMHTLAVNDRVGGEMQQTYTAAERAMSQDGRFAMSDERGKRGAHSEGEMGRALEEGYKPFEYEYKPGFREQEGQQPGEKNVGPMAQNMASNPITGNAVEKGEDGLLRINLPKVTKTNSAGIGYLAAKQREMAEEIARLKGGR